LCDKGEKEKRKILIFDGLLLFQIHNVLIKYTAKKALEKEQKKFYNFLKNVVDWFFLFQYIPSSRTNKQTSKDVKEIAWTLFDRLSSRKRDVL